MIENNGGKIKGIAKIFCSDKTIPHKQNRAKLKKGLIFCSIAIVCTIVIIFSISIIQNSIIPNGHYSNGIKYAKENQWTEAVNEFNSLDQLDYDKTDIELVQKSYYNVGLDYLSKNDLFRAKYCFIRARGYADSRSKLLEVSEHINSTYKTRLACGSSFSVGMKASSGTAIATGNSYSEVTSGIGPSSVSGWHDLIAIDVGGTSGGTWVLGLKSDGSVIASGIKKDYFNDVNDWRNIIAISCGWAHSLGLRSDNTVVATGKNQDGQCNVNDWRDIIAISAGAHHSVGLKSDGTVVAIGDNRYGQCDTSGWSDVINITASENFTAALRADGTILVTGEFKSTEYQKWTNIVDISALHGVDILFGIKADGTVVHCGNYWYFEESQLRKETNNWRNIVAIDGGYNHVLALRSDGKVLSAGEPFNFAADVDSWNLN